jgi:hypothetical protein
MAESKDSGASKAAPAAKAAPATASTVTAGESPSDTERELRNRMAELDQDNRDLRARLEAAGAHVPEPRERKFNMSEGVRQDLILLRHRVDAGELKEEDAQVVDPATTKVYTLADLPADAEAFPGIGDGSK